MSFLRFILATNNFFSWLGTIVLIVLSFSGVVNNVTLIEVAQEFPTTITPYPWAFFYWVLIFGLAGIFVFYQLIPVKRKSNFIFSHIGPFFIYDCIFMFIWLFCWHWRTFWASLVFMIGRLVALIAIYFRLKIDYSEAGRDRVDEEEIPLTTWDYWILQVPFSISLAWTIFSTIFNLVIAVSLSNININIGLSAEIWSVVIQTFFTLLSLLLLRFRFDFFFSGTFTLVQLAIAFNHLDKADISTGGFVNATITGVITLYVALYQFITYLRTPTYEALRN